MKPVRDAGLAAFAWPEARRIGLPLRADQTEQSIEQMQWEIMPAKNRLDGRAVKIRTRFRRLADIDMPPRLLVIAGDRAVGVLVRQTTLPGWSYAGYAAGEAVASERLGILRLRADGSIDCWGGCTASR